LSSAKDSKNRQKDLLSILDAVQHSPRDEEKFDPFQENNVNVVIGDDEHINEGNQPAQVKAAPKKPSKDTNKPADKGKSKSKYEQVRSNDNEEVEFTSIQNKVDNDNNFDAIPEIQKPPEKIKMTILTNYQLENDKKYSMRQEEDVDWKEIPNNVEVEELPAVGPATQLKKKNKVTKKDNKKEGPSILKNIMDEEIGEVGEWIEKSANVDAARDYDDGEPGEDEFDDVFDNTEAASTKKKKPNTAIKETDEDDEEEAGKGKTSEDFEKTRENAKIKANLAASKVNSKKKEGFMMNTLKKKIKLKPFLKQMITTVQILALKTSLH